MADTLRDVFIRSTARAALVLTAGVFLAACGGGGGSDGSQSKSPPNITNFQFNPTAVYVGSVEPFNGTFDFTDSHGDLQSATLEILSSTGAVLQSQTIAITGVSGMKSGTVQGLVDGDTSAPGTFTARIHVVDGHGLHSNALSVSIRISEFPWVARTPMPLPRSEFATVALDGKIYVLGGGDKTIPIYPSPPSDSVQVYDPSTDTWTNANPMLLPLTQHAAAIVDGRIYVVGGSSTYRPGVKTLQVFDPATGTWMQKADMPAERVDGAAASAAGILYYFGGRDPAMDTSIVYAYDPTLDRWSTRASMPDARSGHAAVDLGERVLVLGGYRSAVVTDSGYCRTMYEYDPATDTWTRRADMFWPLTDLAASVIGDEVFTTGGSNWEPMMETEAYSRASDSWHAKTANTQALAWPDAATVNGKMYVFDAQTTLEYTPENDLL